MAYCDEPFISEQFGAFFHKCRIHTIGPIGKFGTESVRILRPKTRDHGR